MAVYGGFRPRLNMVGFTSIPNEFFDEVLPNIKSLAELKVILAVFRKTYGWVDHIDHETGQLVYKEEDNISMSQFRELTGLSQPSCVDGVKRAIEHGYLERVKEGTFNGGNSADNESAVYRIKQVTEDSPEPSPKKETPKKHDLGDIKKEVKEKIEEVNKTKKHDERLDDDMDFTDDSEVNISDPQELLREFFPPTNDEPAPKKKKEPKTFKTKKPTEWNSNDLLAYFNTKYREKIGISAGPITMKDKSLAKKMLASYDTEDLIKAIDYYIENYLTITYLPSGYPSFNIFFGYRKSLIPEALNPTMRKKPGGKNKFREFNEYDPDDEDTGGYTW